MDGAVHLPYLRSWSSLSHALAPLADALIGCFSQEPPVFAVKPPSSSSSSSSSFTGANAASTGANPTRIQATSSSTTATIAAGGSAAGYGSDPARNHRADSHTPPPIFTPPPPPYRSPNPTSNGGAGTSTPPPPPPQFSSSSGKDRLLEEVTRKVRHASRAGVAKIMSLFFFLFSLTAVRSLALVSRCLLRLNVESILHSVVIEGTNSDSYSLPFPVILMIILLASLRIWRSGAVSLA